MKGVILAGGNGTRLFPITKIVNKHLLPVGKFPMVFHSIVKLKEAGIVDILIVTNKRDLTSFYQLLGDGSALEVAISYQVQEKPLGIADGVRRCQSFVDGKFVVLLGDNIFQDSLKPVLEKFNFQEKGARILLKYVEDPRAFGIAKLDEDGNIGALIEKPKELMPSYCVTGIYMYDESVFDVIKEVTISSRGELEITDVNKRFVDKRLMKYDILEKWWIDAGTHESLYLANKYMFDY